MDDHVRLVAVVGGDGAGKSTVSALLVKQLIASGHPARRIDRWDIVGSGRYQSASFLPHDVPHIRRCVAAMPMPARFLFLLWSMSLAVSGSAREAADGEILVLDGYWMKHAASEVAYGMDPDWAMTVASALPAPHAVLRLSLSPEQAWLRKQADVVPYECGMDPACSRESFVRHQGRILELLDRWTAAFGWTEISAAAPLPDIVRQAADHVLSATWTGA